jgi:hypothetical protein
LRGLQCIGHSTWMAAPFKGPGSSP